jgi:hypothetical protein
MGQMGVAYAPAAAVAYGGYGAYPAVALMGYGAGYGAQRGGGGTGGGAGGMARNSVGMGGQNQRFRPY